MKRNKAGMIALWVVGVMVWLYGVVEGKVDGKEERGDTVISSNSLEIGPGEGVHIFRFKDNVQLESKGMKAHCDILEVIKKRGKHEGKLDGTEALKELDLNDKNSIERITAIGHVYIQQGETVASAGKVTILPGEDKMIFEENPEVRDKDGVVKGYRITYHKGERKAQIEGGGPEGQKSTIRLTGDLSGKLKEVEKKSEEKEDGEKVEEKDKK